MDSISKTTAKNLLQIKAIKLQPANPFTWASGWKSPIYCDNRVTLSYPEIRNTIKSSFVKIISQNFPEAEIIAGVATGAIAHGVLVAEAMNLPFIYIRSSAKEHGMANLIEGKLDKNSKVVVIEDLISTGGSSLKAVDAVRNAGATVLGMVSIFTYGFKVAEENFQKSGCKLLTLSNYNDLIASASESGYIKPEDLETLKNWRKNPENWHY